MTRNIWVISDTHFGHESIIKHANRPFSSANEMDEAVADNWNDVVGQDDLVYHLGDIAWKPAKLKLFNSLAGTKRVMLGNHDNGKAVASMVQRLSLFEKRPNWGVVFSHIPLDMEAERFDGLINLHGHIHEQKSPTNRHRNCCVEWTGYKPINLEEIIRIKHDDNSVEFDEAQWLESGRDNDEAFNITEKRYLDRLSEQNSSK